MKTSHIIKAFVFLGFAWAFHAHALTLYVDLNSATPTEPYTSWETAAHTIQEAVDETDDGDHVWVADGIYFLSEEIKIKDDITLESVNGPANTLLDGGGSVRCLNLGKKACTVRGFTIQNGYEKDKGGGVYCKETTPRVIDCLLMNNVAKLGGAMSSGTAYNCRIRQNTASLRGGGMYGGEAYNCSIEGNSSGSSGGGIYRGTINNCTLTRNSSISGGGSYFTVAYNSIIWGNTASSSGDDYVEGSSYYSCSPNFTHGEDGNITNAPALLSASHIATNSPCRGAGSTQYTEAVDIDGEAWASPPSMGCDENLGEGHITGNIHISLFGPKFILSGYPAEYTTLFDGPITKTTVNFGNGLIQTNPIAPITTSWQTSSVVNVILTAYNDDYPTGITYTQAVHVFDAADLFVSGSAGNDGNDGSSWAQAKKTIQAGVDAQQVMGATVWVTNGTYNLSTTINLQKAITVKSVNGPSSTLIDGNESVRCFNLGDSFSVLSGFTIQNGHTEENGGGVYCINNNPSIINCILSDNVANSGGALFSGTANNCIMNGNSATSGGAMYGGVATGCTFKENSASYFGGAMYNGVANNSLFIDNEAFFGGGMYNGLAQRCKITENHATMGGGLYDSTAHASAIYGNTASSDGGGAYDGTLQNCTITGNNANRGGGGRSSEIKNCIVWHNSALDSGDNLYDVTPFYSCSPDLQQGVDGNITNAPVLISPIYIASNSPCRGTGNSTYSSGLDIDGESWLSPPSMGCKEYIVGSMTGQVQIALAGPSTIVKGHTAQYTLSIEGPLTQTTLDFGAGHIETNPPPSISHAWPTAGLFPVVLTAYNDDHPQGMAYTQTIHVLESSFIYVSIENGSDANDGTDWTLAKKTIQAGVDAQEVFGGTVSVQSGFYPLTQEITIRSSLTLQSVNGSAETIIDGGDSVRCLNLGASDCIVSGFTIQNGKTSGNGGGVYCLSDLPVVCKSKIQNNEASLGGGMYLGTTLNCILTENEALIGGGKYNGTAKNCTIAENTALLDGGGMYKGMIFNSIMCHNTSQYGDSSAPEDTRFNCSSPDLTHGINNNITNLPVFVSNENYQQAWVSPCINTGGNQYAPSSLTDMDGHARIINAVVDMGAYEYDAETSDSDLDNMPDAWESMYFGGPTNAIAFIDDDEDGLDNLSEYIAGTLPTEETSTFIVFIIESTEGGCTLSWNAIPNRIYTVYWKNKISDPFQILGSPIASPQNSYTDSSHPGLQRGFYKVSVSL